MIPSNGERATLTVDETATLLGISRSLAFQMARDGRIPVIRFGRRILVPRACIDRLLEPFNHDQPDPSHITSK